MVYKTFLDDVCLAVAARLGDSFSVSLQQIPKNNGVLSDSLCIQKPPSPVSAAIYLGPFFEEYRNGMPLSSITSEILDLYRSHSLPPAFRPEQFLSFETCRKNLACKLINTSRNQTALSSIPHIPFLDLSIVFCIFTESEDEIFTSLVNNSQIKLWGITEDELFIQAKANSMLLFPPVIRELDEVIREMISPDGRKQPKEEKEASAPIQEEKPLIYVLTNTKGVNGAYSMLYPGVLESFAQAAGSDLVIIPSSIHEVLLIPQESDMDYSGMDDTIREVNQNEVPTEDHLSDHTYFYSRMSGRIFLPSGISARLP